MKNSKTFLKSYKVKGFIVFLILGTIIFTAAEYRGGKVSATTTTSKTTATKKKVTTQKKKTKQVKVTKVSVLNKQVSMRVGEKIKLKTKVAPSNATTKSLKYVTSNAAYATVNSKGVLTVKKAGVGHFVKVYAVAKDGSKKKDHISIYILSKINPKKKMVALTFDDGPNAKTTPQLLAILRKEKIPVTFFVVGTGVKASPSLVKKAYLQGCEIGSHTTNHIDLTKASKKAIKKNVAANDALIKKVIGKKASLLRPPYGANDAKVRAAIDKPLIIWSVDPEDWKTRNTAQNYKRVLANTHDGSIVLSHDTYQQTIDAYKKIIPALKKKGYQFVTVSELYKYKKAKLRSHQVHYSVN